MGNIGACKCQWRRAAHWVALRERDFCVCIPPSLQGFGYNHGIMMGVGSPLCQPGRTRHACAVASCWVPCQTWWHTSAAEAQVLLPLLLPLHAPFVCVQGQKLSEGYTECCFSREQRQALWRTSPTQRKWAVGTQYSQHCSLPPLHGLQLSTVVPHNPLGTGRAVGTRGTALLHPKGLHALRCSQQYCNTHSPVICYDLVL